MYILKYYIKSKYLGFNRVYYKEFELFSDLEYFIDHNDIKNYTVYGIMNKEIINRKNYLLKQQGAELKELYSEIDKLQGRIDKAIEYLEEPNRDSFDYSKAKLLDILKEAE